MVAHERVGRQLPFAFLEKVRGEFQDKHAESSRTLHAHSLDKTFGCAFHVQCNHPAASDGQSGMTPSHWGHGPCIMLSNISRNQTVVVQLLVTGLDGLVLPTQQACLQGVDLGPVCRPRLKYWMDYCQEHPEEISKIASVQKKVHDPPCFLLCNQQERMVQQ